MKAVRGLWLLYTRASKVCNSSRESAWKCCFFRYNCFCLQKRWKNRLKISQISDFLIFYEKLGKRCSLTWNKMCNIDSELLCIYTIALFCNSTTPDVAYDHIKKLEIFIITPWLCIIQATLIHEKTCWWYSDIHMVLQSVACVFGILQRAVIFYVSPHMLSRRGSPRVKIDGGGGGCHDRTIAGACRCDYRGLMG